MSQMHQPIAVCNHREFEKLFVESLRFGRHNSEDNDPTATLQMKTLAAILAELGKLAERLKYEEHRKVYLLGLVPLRGRGVIVQLDESAKIAKESIDLVRKLELEELYYCVYLVGLDFQNNDGVIFRLLWRNNFHWELASKELTPEEVGELQRCGQRAKPLKPLTQREVNKLRKHWADGYQYVDCQACSESERRH